MSCVLRYLLGALFFFALSSVQAQQYPVTASTQVIPPYSVYLPDYAVPGSDKLRVILIQNDLTQPSYDVILQMTVEQNGTLIMRTSAAFHPRPLTLTSGVPTIISGSDLSQYLSTNNIDFSGGFSRENYDRTKALPEGAYRITFTAFDYRRPTVQVSNAGANVFFFRKSDPPLLNLPVCGSRVEKHDPQFLSFNWSSRNTPNSSTEYIFSLYEIKPKNSNADYIVRSAQPLYTSTTESNTLIYGPGEPQLIDSMEYVWVVQARDKNGRDLFSNQGYSQSCKFTYLGTNPFQALNINKPVLYGQSVGERSVKFWWPLATRSSQYAVETYRIQYRAAGGDFDWYTEEKEKDSTLTLHSLEPGRSYEARLQWRVSGVYGPYSELVTVTTDSLRVFSCGDGSPLKLPDNSQPLPSAIAGNIVRIGNFDVMLTQVSGGEGVFSGTGRVITPGFGMGLPMRFSGISINTDYVVTRGEMQAVTSGMDKFVSDEIKNQRGGDEVGQVKTGDIVPDIRTQLHLFTKDNISVDTAIGRITLSAGAEGKEVIDYKATGKTLPLVIEDADGHLFNIDKNGTVSDAGTRDKSINTAALNNLDLSKGRVIFSAAAGNKYAFDAWKETYKGRAVLDSSYELIDNYRVSAKAIIPGAQESVTATIEGSLDNSKIKFVSSKGIVYPFTNDGDHYTVKITGGPAGDAQKVYAVCGDKSVGKLLVASYAPQQRKVVLIPIGTAAVPEAAIQSSLAKAYAGIGITYTVETDESFRDAVPKDYVLQDTKSAFLSNSFTGEEKKLKKAYARGRDIEDDVTYLFVVNEAAMSGADLYGKMPRQSQFGFIFVKNVSAEEVGRTVAHETGHGAYTLEHTFSNGIGLSQRSTDNLMDYKDGYELLKYQWDVVHDPGHVWGIFEGDDESAMGKGQSLYKCLNDAAKSALAAKRIFYAPDGDVVILPAGAVPAAVFYKDVSPANKAMKGSLASFIYNKKEYNALYYEGQGAFAGYSYDAADAATFIKSAKITAGQTVTIIEPGSDDASCEIKIDGTVYPNAGCLCQNTFYKKNYDLFNLLVINAGTPEVEAEIQSLCKTLSELPADVLETNNQLFNYTYNGSGDYWFNAVKDRPKITIEQLKKVHEKFITLDANIKRLKAGSFSDAAELLSFINEHFVVSSKDGFPSKSYLTNRQFVDLTPELRYDLIMLLMSSKELRERKSISNAVFYEQDIIVELIKNCKTTAEVYAVISDINTVDGRLYTLLSRMSDYLYLSEGNFTLLSNAITAAVIDVEKLDEDDVLAGELILSGKWIELDNGLLTARNKEDFDDATERIKFEVGNGAGIVIDWLFDNKYGKANLFKDGFKPLDKILIIPKRNINAYGTTFLKGGAYILPAIGVYTLFKLDTKNAVVTTSAIAVNTALCMVGGAGLSSAGTLANFTFAVDLTLSNFTIFANGAPELYEDHREFVKYLNYFTYCYTLGRIGYSAYGMTKMRTPPEVVEAYFAEDAAAIQKRIVIIGEGELEKVKSSLITIKDDNVYVAIHGKNDKFFATINGVEEEMSGASLAIHLLEKEISAASNVVLLSCSDIGSAHLLADLLDRPVYASHGYVDVFENGVIVSEYAFVKVTPHTLETEAVTFRIGKSKLPEGQKVRLGGVETPGAPSWRSANEMRADLMDWAKKYRESLPSNKQREKFTIASVASYTREDGSIGITYGRNGGVSNTKLTTPTISMERGIPLQQELKNRLPKETQWPNEANCGECDCVNQALYDKAVWDKIQIHTMRVLNDGSMIDVIQCDECGNIFQGMHVTSQ